MQKQSLLHPFPACQPGSCWLFIKGAAQVRRMHPDALIDCLLPCGDSSWMDWTVGGEERGRKALTPSLPLSDTLLHSWPVSFLPGSPSHTCRHRLLTLIGLQPGAWLNAWVHSHPENLNTIISTGFSYTQWKHKHNVKDKGLSYNKVTNLRPCCWKHQPDSQIYNITRKRLSET